MKKICKKCGTKIPRKVPHTNKKTNRSRLQCYNCNPGKLLKVDGDKRHHRLERRRRKEILVKMLGGHCAICGYNKSITALSFHHKQPKKKCFDISSNGNLLRDWDEIVQEVQKCKLLCLNCHAEYHNKR